MCRYWVWWTALAMLVVSCTVPITRDLPTDFLTAPTVDAQMGLPNPASIYCEEQGYALEIRTAAGGGQYGVCIFPDGSECEEWSYYRGGCTPANAGGAVAGETIAYVSTVGGFAFDYPATWNLEEAPQALKLTRDEILIYIAYRSSDEEWGIHWTGMPEGEWKDAGQVSFLGQILEKTQLVFDGKVKVVTYELPADVPSLSGIEVRVRVDDRSRDSYADVEISDEMQAETEQILASFRSL